MHRLMFVFILMFLQCLICYILKIKIKVYYKVIHKVAEIRYVVPCRCQLWWCHHICIYMQTMMAHSAPDCNSAGSVNVFQQKTPRGHFNVFMTVISSWAWHKLYQDIDLIKEQQCTAMLKHTHMQYKSFTQYHNNWWELQYLQQRPAAPDLVWFTASQSTTGPFILPHTVQQQYFLH